MLLLDGITINASTASNSSRIEQKDVLVLEPYIVPVFFGLIFVSGVVGNGGLMFIICRYKSMRNLPNIFVFNLALGDLFVLLFTVPFTTSIYIFDSWPFGELVCKASEFAKDTSVGVSVFTLTALSFDRYNVIVNPVQSYVAGPKSKRRIITSLAVIWLASLGLALPAASFSHILFIWVNKTGEWTSSRSLQQPDTELLLMSDEANRTVDEPSYFEFHVCYPFPGEFGPIYAQIVILGRFLFHYFIPLLVVSTLYTIVARHLKRSAGIIPGQATLTTGSFNRSCPSDISSNNANNNQESRRKAAVMVQCFVGLFAICFLPIHVYSLWFHFDPRAKTRYNQYWHSFRIFGFVLAYINSCINPIALYFLSTNFRKHFNRLLFCGSDSIITSDGRSALRSRSECHRDNYPLDEFVHHQDPPRSSFEPTLQVHPHSTHSQFLTNSEF